MSADKAAVGPIRRVRAVPRLTARSEDANKGDFGRILVIGGSVGMAGAPSLVAMAALRGGAGLVTVAVPASIQTSVAVQCPCATTIGLPETATGQIDPVAARRLFAERGLLAVEGAGTPPDVLVIGPGIGRGTARYGAALWELINAFRNGPLVSAVIDADALNLIQRSGRGTPAGWDDQDHFSTVITPHPGELGRMHGVGAGDIQADREAYAIKTARMMATVRREPEYTPVVVLKGAGTLVTDGTRLYTNRTGNPGMASGGSGDVLAGLIGALLGQGATAFNAAVLGVYLHGLAGDLAVARKGQISLIATDLIDALPEAFLKHAQSG